MEDVTSGGIAKLIIGAKIIRVLDDGNKIEFYFDNGAVLTVANYEAYQAQVWINGEAIL